MSDLETKIIPLDDAHEILSTFGVGPYSRQYQRWRREDGFRNVEFEGVLAESSLVLVVDWRECLQDAVDGILRQLGELGISGTADLGDEGNEGQLQIGAQSKRIKFVLADDDDFDRVIAVVNLLIGQTARYRKFRSCEGTDGWSYAALKNKDWLALEASAGATLRQLFA